MAIDPKNIIAFNRTVATLFTDLYEAFPTPQKLNAKDLAARAAEAGDDFDGAFDYISIASHTVTWLASEGFITISNKAYGGEFLGVSLTLKGFTLLGQVPAGLQANEAQETLASNLKKAVSKGAEGAVSDGVKALVGQVFLASLRFGAQSLPTAGLNA